MKKVRITPKKSSRLEGMVMNWSVYEYFTRTMVAQQKI